MSSLSVKGIKRGKRRRKRRNQKRSKWWNQDMILPLQLLLLQWGRNLPSQISRTELPNWPP
jgi:hypothetical protein